jgi:hypothetical protein
MPAVPTKDGVPMRAFGPRPRAFAMFVLAAVFCGGWAIAQPAAPSAATGADEGQSLGPLRAELERTRDEVFRRFNESNRGRAADVTCKDEQPTGSRMRQNVCRSAAENTADAGAAQDFLGSLLRGAGSSLGGAGANIGTSSAQAEATAGEAQSLGGFEQEWVRLLREDPEFYQAVVEYVEAEKRYNRARGVVEPSDLELRVAGLTAGRPGEPQCEASTLTEYQQRNNVARVTGTVSVAACPAGTTGTFTLVARLRDDSGESKTVEFLETWQRDDTGDHTFNTDYPIGEDVELISVRVRNLKCTCAEIVQ